MRTKADDRIQQVLINDLEYVLYDSKKRRKEKNKMQKQMSKMFDTELNIILDVTNTRDDWKFFYG